MRAAALLAAVHLAALLAAPATASGGGRSHVPSPVTPDEDGCCLASTGRDFVAAIGDARCASILLDGVVSVYDVDFPPSPVVRAANVTIRSAAAHHGGGAASALPRAALEAAPALHRNVDLAPGAVASLADISVAGAAAGGSPSNGVFSVFRVAPGATLQYTGCDLRARGWLCVPDASDPGGTVNITALQAASVGPVASRRADVDGDVVVEYGEIDASVFYGGPRSPPSDPPPPVLRMINSTMWCTASAPERDGRTVVPGDGAARVAARVLSSEEVAAALGATGSRTLLLSDSLALPPTGAAAPGALVQDRDVVLRSAAAGKGDGGASPPRVALSVRAPPSPRDCVQPVVAAGPGSSVALSAVDLVAAAPGCAAEPAVRCAVGGGGGVRLQHPLRGTLLPAGAFGVSAGGWLLFDGVDVAYGECTPAFAECAARVADAVPAGGAALARLPGGGLVLTCTRCDFEGCVVPGSSDAPGAASLRNTTLRCGGPAAAAVAAAAAAGFGGAAAAPARAARADVSVALIATLSIAAAVVVAGAVGAALGARHARVAARVAAVEGGAGGGAVEAAPRWKLFGRQRKVTDDSGRRAAAAAAAGAPPA